MCPLCSCFTLSWEAMGHLADKLGPSRESLRTALEQFSHSSKCGFSLGVTCWDFALEVTVWRSQEPHGQAFQGPAAPGSHLLPH